MPYVCTLIRGQMSNTVNQFGGRCPHISFLKGGQMSGGNMSYTRDFYVIFR